jgi:hypothetical protein
MKEAFIPSIVTCPRGHDHGLVTVHWVYENDDPFALTVGVPGTDEFWQLPRLELISRLRQAEPGSALECGVLSLQLRRSNPSLLSMRFTTHTENGPRITYLICNVMDLAAFLDSLRHIAPRKYSECNVDDVIAKIFAEA